MGASLSKLVVHDPYGGFDPALKSRLFGKSRWEGGACLAPGGEMAPGKGTRLVITGASRRRAGERALGTYFLLSATR